MKVTLGMAALVLAATALAAQAADAPTVFNQCKICHSIVKGRKMIGPSLFGVVGRKAGTEPGFNYSEAFKKKMAGVTWDEAQFEKFVADPRGVVEGTRMMFAGLKDEKDRDAVWSYLKTLK